MRGGKGEAGKVEIGSWGIGELEMGVLGRKIWPFSKY